MKNLFKKLFYWDAPAQGAFFALTLWGIGSYLTASLLLWMTVSEFLLSGTDAVLKALIAALGLILGLTAYFLGLLLRFYYQSGRDNRSYALPVMLVLCAAGLAAGAGLGGVFCATTAALAFGLWFFPALLLPRIRCRDYLLHALFWSTGTVVIATVCGIYYNYFGKIMFDGFDGIAYDGLFESVAGFCHLSGKGWGWFWLSGILFTLTGYLLTAKVLGAALNVPFRRMFDKKIIILWVLAAANYFIFGAMAVSADRQAAKELKTLAQHFGHPMTMEAVGQLYYGKDQPDARFWQTIDEYAEQCGDDSQAVTGTDLLCSTDDISADLMTLWKKEFFRQNAVLPQWEEAFDGVIPPEAGQYQTGKSGDIPTSRYMNIKRFIVLESWCLRFALEDNDIDGAWRAYQRLKHAAAALSRNSYMIGGLFWIAAQNQRLEAVQLLLESGKLSPSELQTLATETAEMEQKIIPLYQQSLYSEAVYCLNAFDMMDQGGRLDLDKREWPPYRLTRYFMPQLWWYGAVNRRYLIEYFKPCAACKVSPNPSRFYTTLLPALPPFKTKFDWLTARVRAAGVVIRAAEYQRQHGEYPKTLKNLPPDPFNVKPMQYRSGPCEIPNDTISRTNGDWKRGSGYKTVPGVICWSVGPNLADNNGVRHNSPDADKIDDISFMIQTKP